MKRYAAFLCLLSLSSAAVAGAKIDFAEYVDAPIIKQGTGGTKISKHGIDYWTSGDPLRCYQLIGRVSDRRNEEWDGGHG